MSQVILVVETCMRSCSVVSVMSDPLRPHGLQPARLLCPWNSLGKNTEMSCHFLLQGVFLTQELNLGLLHCRQVLIHCLSHQRSCYCIYSYAIYLLLFLLFGILSSLLFIWFLLLNIKTKPCSHISYSCISKLCKRVVEQCVCMHVCVSFSIEEILKHNSIS